MGIKFANSAFATLASGINSSATSITLTTGQGARFPSLSGGDYFYATLIDTSNNLEIVKCTARSTDVLTVTRGQESTTARAFSTGDRIELRITAAGLNEAVGILDGDRGDITVSNNGMTWTIDNAAITDAKIAAMAATKLTGTIDKARFPTGMALQVVQTVKSDTFSTTSTSLVDITGLSATITPTSASSKILVFVDLHIGYSVYAGIVHLLRGSTKIYAGDGGLTRCGLYSNVYASPQHILLPVTATFLDNPATTSATTYKLQTANYGAGTQWVNRTSDDINDPNRDGRTASSITLIEVVA